MEPLDSTRFVSEPPTGAVKGLWLGEILREPTRSPAESPAGFTSEGFEVLVLRNDDSDLDLSSPMGCQVSEDALGTGKSGAPRRHCRLAQKAAIVRVCKACENLIPIVSCSWYWVHA